MKHKGRITPNGVVLKTHENATAVFLTEQGLDVDLIPASNIKRLKVITKTGKTLDFEK